VADRGGKRPFDDPIPLPRGPPDIRELGKLFTHIHDQEIEISERFFDVICPQMPHIALRTAATWER